MKIIVASTLYPPYILGGAEVSTRLLVNGLVAQGHYVVVVTTGEVDAEEWQDGARVIRLKNRNIYWRYPQRDKPLMSKMLWHAIDIYNVAYRSAITKIFEEEAPDIVHTGNLCGLSAVVWDVARSLDIPIVHTLRDYYLMCPQQSMIKGNKSCEKSCAVCSCYSVGKRILSQKVDAVVGISDFILKKHIRAEYFKNAHHWDVIPNSVEEVAFERSNDRKKKVVGYLGRLSSEKGVDFLLQAFLQSDHSAYGATLMIAGDGNESYVSELKSKYRNPNVLFLGNIKKEDFFASVDVLVVPSLWDEPFGRVVIEGYAYQCPVLMADTGGLKELMEEGLSYSFSTQDTAQLTTLLNRFYKGELVFNEAKFVEVLGQYSEQSVVDAYIDLYKKLING